MTKDDIAQLAALSRLDLDEQAQQDLVSEFDSILSYVSQLESEEIGAKNNRHCANYLRGDVVVHESEEYTEALTAQFPEEKDGYMVVPKIL